MEADDLDERWQLEETDFLKRRAPSSSRRTTLAGGDQPHDEDRENEPPAVRVIVDIEGRVLEVKVDEDWDRSLDAQELPEALLHAYMGAMLAAGSAGLTRLQDPDFVQILEEAEHLDDSGPAPEPEGSQEWFARMMERRRRIEELSGQIRAREETPASKRIVKGDYGIFTLRVAGNVVTGITGSAQIIAMSDSRKLARDALGAFQRVGSGRAT